MNEPEQHGLELVATIDEWYHLQCPTCKRAVRFNKFDMEVLNQGDFYAQHEWSPEDALGISAQ